MAKHHSKPHKSKAQVLHEMKATSQECRMSNIKPWAAMQVLTSYALLRTDNYKGRRLGAVAACVNDFEERWYNGEIDLETYADRLWNTGGFRIEIDGNNEDVNAKTYDGLIKSAESRARNDIVKQTRRYLIWFYNVLIDRGFRIGKLTKVCEEVDRLQAEYDKKSELWTDALLREAKFCVEPPRDPVTGEVYIVNI